MIRLFWRSGAGQAENALWRRLFFTFIKLFRRHIQKSCRNPRWCVFCSAFLTMYLYEKACLCFCFCFCAIYPLDRISSSISCMFMIVCSYFMIPVCVFYFVRRYRDGRCLGMNYVLCFLFFLAGYKMVGLGRWVRMDWKDRKSHVSVS